MIAVRDHFDRFADALVVVVTFADDPARLAAYRSHLDLDRPGVDIRIVADVDRVLYDRLGAGRGSLRRVWSPGTIAMYTRLVWRGRRLRSPTEDTRQLGADAVLDRDGRVHRVWLPPSPDTRPDVAELVAAVHELERA